MNTTRLVLAILLLLVTAICYAWTPDSEFSTDDITVFPPQVLKGYTGTFSVTVKINGTAYSGGGQVYVGSKMGKGTNVTIIGTAVELGFDVSVAGTTTTRAWITCLNTGEKSKTTQPVTVIDITNNYALSSHSISAYHYKVGMFGINDYEESSAFTVQGNTPIDANFYVYGALDCSVRKDGLNYYAKGVDVHLNKCCIYTQRKGITIWLDNVPGVTGQLLVDTSTFICNIKPGHDAVQSGIMKIYDGFAEIP